LKAPWSKELRRVGTEAGYFEVLDSPRRIAVKASLDFVFEVVEDNLLDAAFNSAFLAVEVTLRSQQTLENFAKALIDVT
jgi:hypothetical protein